MVEKELEFAMLIAIVNNNLIAYDQSRDLAFAIDSAIKEGTGEDGEERRSDGSTESLSLTLADTEVHAEMEDTCRCALDRFYIGIRQGAHCIVSQLSACCITMQVVECKFSQ